MNLQSSYQNIEQNFNDYFSLEKQEDISKFFPKEKNNLQEVAGSQIERIKHYLRTGKLINEHTLCIWAEKHADAKISALFEGTSMERKLIRYEYGMTVAKDSCLKYVKTVFNFIKEFISHPTTVGAILPSSEGLAKEIASEIPKEKKEAQPRRILEVGPGTGIFTEKIIKRMNPQDELVLVEFDKKFCKKLWEKFGHIPNVKIIHGDILKHKVDPNEKYDFIVSGLPLNGFQKSFVEQVFDKFSEVIKDKGKISYFEYVGIPHIKRLFSSKKEAENLDGILGLKGDFYRKHQLRKAEVYMNVPVARVLHHHFHKTPPNSPLEA